MKQTGQGDPSSGRSVPGAEVPRGYGETGSANRSVPFQVSWYSSVKVRQAMGRLGQLQSGVSAEQVNSFVQHPLGDYIIAVSGLLMKPLEQCNLESLKGKSFVISKKVKNKKLQLKEYVSPKERKDGLALFTLLSRGNWEENRHWTPQTRKYNLIPVRSLNRSPLGDKLGSISSAACGFQRYATIKISFNHQRRAVMANNPIGWFEIYVQDMNRAKRSYESVFATRLERLESPDIEMWAFSMNPGQPGAPGSLVKMEGFPSGGNSTIVYFTCSDCSIEAKRASSSGGKIFKDKFSIGQYGYIALVTDTEGNMIGLHSMQ